MSDDHVPPQSVIGFNHNLVVPSCVSCNSGASKDDEYFQFAVSMAAATDSHPKISEIRERVFRGLGKEKARKYRDLIIRNIEISDEIEEDHEFSNYMERIKSVSERITRGLYYIEKNRNRLPSYYEVTTYIGNEYMAYGTENTHNFKALFRPLLDTEVHMLGDPPVFEYHFAEIDDSNPCATVWYFKYFGGYELFALTLPNGDPRQLRTHFPRIHNMHLLPRLATLIIPACAELSDWLREQLGEPIGRRTRTKTQESIGVTPILHGRLGKYSDSKERLAPQSKARRGRQMSIIGKIHRPGELTGMVVSAATHAPGPESVYLGFRTPDDEQENVEISVEEAVALHGWLAELVNRIQGQDKAPKDIKDEEIEQELAEIRAKRDEAEQDDP